LTVPELTLGLEPILQLKARFSPALQIDFVRPTSDLLEAHQQTILLLSFGPGLIAFTAVTVF